jgi:hypothetical protein
VTVTWRSWAVPILTSFLVCTSSAQTQPVTKIELRPGDKISVTNQMASAEIDPVRCDASGAVYMRTPPRNGGALTSPILRISPDGHSSLAFDVAVVDEIKQAVAYGVQDFVVSKMGKIYALVAYETKAREDLVAIVEFDDSPDKNSLIHIDSHFSPRQIAVTQGGTFLLSGLQVSTKTSGTATTQNRTPFTALFNAQGRYIKEVDLPDEVKLEDYSSAKRGKPDLSAQQAVDLSRMVVGDDGNIYFLRNTKEPKVYVISTSGDVLRTIPVKAVETTIVGTSDDADDASTGPSIFYGGGRLAFDFYVPDGAATKLEIRVVNPENGQIMWDYVPAKDMYGIPACYDGSRFTFLAANEDRHLAIFKATP